MTIADNYPTLDVTISKDNQDVNFTRLLMIAGHKVRLRIRSNPYEFQCHAYADVWSPEALKWNNVAEIGHGSMQTPSGMYVWSERGLRGTWNNAAIFEPDAKRLIALAAAVLGG